MLTDADRPPVALGHAMLQTTAPSATTELLLSIGFRQIVAKADFAVLEIRGGTHVIVRGVPPTEQPDAVGWDIMVDDIDDTHGKYTRMGLPVSEIRRGSIHDYFELTLPDGRPIPVNSSHAGARTV